jgi:hypothetical protein
MQRALEKAGYQQQYTQNGQKGSNRGSISEDLTMGEDALSYEGLEKEIGRKREENEAVDVSDTYSVWTPCEGNPRHQDSDHRRDSLIIG